MNLKYPISPLLMSCALAVVAGCASPVRQTSYHPLDDENVQPQRTTGSADLFQQPDLDQRASQNLDLNADDSIVSEIELRADPAHAAKDNFSALEENDFQINPAEFPTPAPRHSKLDSVFGGSDASNTNDFFWDGQKSQPQGLRLFTFRF